MLRIALQGLRGRKGPFAGAFVALAVAAALVMACATLTEAGLRAAPAVERYAGAPIVVAGHQQVAIDAGTENADAAPLFERARVPAALAPRLAAVPGVRAAIADVSAPAALRGPRGAVTGPAGHPIAVHPWDTAALTPYTLAQRPRAGRRPRARRRRRARAPRAAARRPARRAVLHRPRPVDDGGRHRRDGGRGDRTRACCSSRAPRPSAWPRHPAASTRSASCPPAARTSAPWPIACARPPAAGCAS